MWSYYLLTFPYLVKVLRGDGIIAKNTIIPLNKFLIAVNFVLESRFSLFIFNQRFYKQIFGRNIILGTLMGSPISPVVAEIVLQDLEISAIEILPVQSLLSLRERYRERYCFGSFL